VSDPGESRLWHKGAATDESIHRFTVGDDPRWDAHLVHWDCLGSAAHARTLHRAGVLSDDELRSLLDGLAEIDALARDGRFGIPPELEDCHTAIEAHLTRTCGEAGAKIHAGRSRNDQVATAMRLLMRSRALEWIDLLRAFAETALFRMGRDGAAPMPGYTHLQPAMPSSVGQWLHAIAEGALEQVRACLDLLDRLDCCPLGTGAGYGVPLPLDRKFTACLLGFSRVQRSPIDAQNSRGRMEKYFARVAADIGAVLERLGADVVLFAADEFGFFSLPEALTTGSSIMPQKRNPDAAELLRAHGARLRARVAEIESICGKLGSGYHRDLQLTKEPAIRCGQETAELLRVASRVLECLEFQRERMSVAMRPELYATHAALELVRQGVPFREAYRRVAGQVRSGAFGEEQAKPYRAAAAVVSAETIAAIRADAAHLGALAATVRERVATAERTLLATR
jgi:argininosuccinate lyase